MIAEIELNRTDSREHPRFKARGLVLVVGETAGATALLFDQEDRLVVLVNDPQDGSP